MEAAGASTEVAEAKQRRGDASSSGQQHGQPRRTSMGMGAMSVKMQLIELTRRKRQGRYPFDAPGHLVANVLGSSFLRNTPVRLLSVVLCEILEPMGVDVLSDCGLALADPEQGADNFTALWHRWVERQEQADEEQAGETTVVQLVAEYISMAAEAVAAEHALRQQLRERNMELEIEWVDGPEGGGDTEDEDEGEPATSSSTRAGQEQRARAIARILFAYACDGAVWDALEQRMTGAQHRSRLPANNRYGWGKELDRGRAYDIVMWALELMEEEAGLLTAAAAALQGGAAGFAETRLRLGDTASLFLQQHAEQHAELRQPSGFHKRCAGAFALDCFAYAGQVLTGITSYIWQGSQLLLQQPAEAAVGRLAGVKEALMQQRGLLSLPGLLATQLEVADIDALMGLAGSVRGADGANNCDRCGEPGDGPRPAHCPGPHQKHATSAGHTSLQCQALDVLADVFWRNNRSLAGLVGTLGQDLATAVEAALEAHTTAGVAPTLDQKHAMLAVVERIPDGLTVLETLPASARGLGLTQAERDRQQQQAQLMLQQQQALAPQSLLQQQQAALQAHQQQQQQQQLRAQRKQQTQQRRLQQQQAHKRRHREEARYVQQQQQLQAQQLQAQQQQAQQQQLQAQQQQAQQ